MVSALPLPETDWYAEEPDISGLVIEDDAPVDSIFTEKQERLLTEPLYASWSGPPPESDKKSRSFAVLANVGLFSSPTEPPAIPNVMLGVDIQLNSDLTQKKNRSYFLWQVGKAPDVVIEIVSNREGGELDEKLQRYRRLRVSYYVVFDPMGELRGAELRSFETRGSQYVAAGRPWFEPLGLGLVVWEGEFEGMQGRWLRWCDLDGRLIPAGVERAKTAEDRAKTAEENAKAANERAKAAEERAALLLAQLQKLGIDPAQSG